MNIKHKDLVIPEDNPFQNCKLGRSKNAGVLTTIVNTYTDSFVLAINNKWGTGKTTFIKMWQQQLKNSEYKTLYFNAWENDFESSPLIALMGELKTLIPGTKGKAKFKALTKNAGVLAKNILPTIAGAIASKYINVGDLAELIKNATEAGVEIFKDEIEKYSTKKNGLIEFRKNLTEFITELNTDKPIVFIIDELDRCRPNYAVEVLENIKHFFNVSNIVFVLSIDKEQLSHAIRGVYGSENLDATEYLRRFIDIEYQLPEPEIENFCDYLFDYFKFNEFFSSSKRKNSGVFNDDEQTFLSLTKFIFKKERLALRQIEQIFGFSRIVLRSFAETSHVFPDLLVFLIYLKITDNHLYIKICQKSLTLEELNNELNRTLYSTFNNSDIEYLIYLQASMIYRYHKYFDFNIKIDYPEKLILHPIFEQEANNNYQRILIHLASSTTARIGLGYLLNRINLTENIIL